MSLAPFDPNLVDVGDYLYSATFVEPLVVGKRGNGWWAKVVGKDAETGIRVGVAVYDRKYNLKADAIQRSRELFAEVLDRRKRHGVGS